jgi:AraC-like DNA-binding protein
MMQSSQGQTCPRLIALAPVPPMLDYADLDMMARGGSLALILLWSWLLYRDHRSVLVVRVALLMNAALCCHLLADTAPWGPQAGVALFLVKIGQTAAPGFFWIFARLWFNDEDRVGWSSWLLITLCVALNTIALLTFGDGPNRYFVIDALVRLFWAGFALAGLWAAWRGRADDLVEGRRRLRTRFVAAIGGYVLLVVGVGFIANSDPEPNMIFWAVNLGIPLLTGILCASMFGIRHTDLFAPPAVEAQPTQPVLLDDSLANRLLAFMAHEKPHRDETLTIAGLAAQLGEQEYRLRRLINGQMGHRNFAAFLNGYRLAEVKTALTDPTQKDVPILTIALDAGFGSLGPFNRAFREAEGCTPSEYRAGKS